MTRAFLLKRTVLARWVGFVNLAKTMPVMQASMNTPTMLCTLITTMAIGHWEVVARPPYLEIGCYLDKDDIRVWCLREVLEYHGNRMAIK